MLCVYTVCRLELLRAERENAMFPDEVDTPQDTTARTRFQKYNEFFVSSKSNAALPLSHYTYLLSSGCPELMVIVLAGDVVQVQRSQEFPHLSLGPARKPAQGLRPVSGDQWRN